MHVGRSYRFVEFAFWSRRSILYMIVVSAIAIAVYSFPGIAGFSVPWPFTNVVGTTVALVAGFKNSNVFGRSTEAMQAFAQISASSRMWAGFCKDFADAATARTLDLPAHCLDDGACGSRSGGRCHGKRWRGNTTASTGAATASLRTPRPSRTELTTLLGD